MCGLSAVNLRPFWKKTSMIESLPQNESRRRSGLILSISSGYAWMRMGTPASCSAATAPFSSPKLGRQRITPS